MVFLDMWPIFGGFFIPFVKVNKKKVAFICRVIFIYKWSLSQVFTEYGYGIELLTTLGEMVETAVWYSWNHKFESMSGFTIFSK
jgi:hypothetical protein